MKPPHHNRLWPFFRDYPGEPVPEEHFWTLWCKRRLTEADTLTIRLGATPSRLTSAYLHHPPDKYETRSEIIVSGVLLDIMAAKLKLCAVRASFAECVAAKCCGYRRWHETNVRRESYRCIGRQRRKSMPTSCVDDRSLKIVKRSWNT